MADRVFLAVDLGASSGRVLAGSFDGEKLLLQEVHRFDNGPAHVAGRMYWDLLHLWEQVQQGLRSAAARYGKQVQSVGVDTWGVDFALLADGDELLGNPYHYRDRRTQGALERAFEIVPREEIFRATGIQFMEINTLYQLLAMKWQESPLLGPARRMLMIPDLFHWLLSGRQTNEFTNASTTQMLDPRTGDWAHELLRRFELPLELLGPISQPGEVLGALLPDVARQTGLEGVQVVLPPTHDTAAAVLAVPAQGTPGGDPSWCYISSGTWSLMGVESPEPVLSDECLKLNFTNEGGVGRTVRLLKNITGLWLLQECRRVWNRQGRDFSWEDLTRLADQAPPLRCFINPDAPDFVAPESMPEAIRQFCNRTGQEVPSDEGAIVRCAVESLAMKCRQVLSWLERLTGTRVETIHIVGGGTRNTQLCQATADACGRLVLAGPVEATATGNCLMQAIAAGELGSVEEARAVVRSSFPLETYEPHNTAAWDEAYERFLTVSPEPE